MTQRMIDVTAHRSSSAQGGQVTGVFFLRHSGPPTVCGARDKRDPAYYCIRSSGHPKRHRYGIVIEGDFRARTLAGAVR